MSLAPPQRGQRRAGRLGQHAEGAAAGLPLDDAAALELLADGGQVGHGGARPERADGPVKLRPAGTGPRTMSWGGWRRSQGFEP